MDIKEKKSYTTVILRDPDNPEAPIVQGLIPDWPAPANVRAFFTLRTEGFSSGPYGDIFGNNGLNLGLHTGDDKETVLANRKLLNRFQCKDIKWLSQCHSTKVLNAEDVQTEPPKADASVTTKPNIGCVVMTADCLPVLLCTSDGEVIGAAHAGWRGLADGVIQETVKEMRKKLKEGKVTGTETEILAWLGPRIGKDAFVVQDDVRQHYLNSALKDGVEENIKPFSEGYLLDLAGMAKLALAQVGVTQVFDSGLSTYENPELFYSYRRDGITGRHGAVIYKYAEER